MAQWARNEATANARTAKLVINSDGFAPAPRGTDFMALGIVFLSRGSSVLELATGTMANDRHPLIVADFAITATDQVNDRVTKAAHGLETGDGPFRPTTTAGNLNAAVDYWAIYYSDNEVSWATSLANAYAGVKVDINADVTGMIFQDQASTARGIDGRFTYQATQPETNTTASEIGIYVEGAGYRNKNGGGTYTSVDVISSAADYGAQAIEGARSRDDLLRLIARFCRGQFTKVGTLYTWRNLDDTKDSFFKEVTAAGCIDSDDIDLT
jgi:hypothetical protein